MYLGKKDWDILYVQLSIDKITLIELKSGAHYLKKQ